MSAFMKTFAFILIPAIIIGSCPAWAAETLVLKGSTTVLPIAQTAAHAYVKKHPGVNISISGGGSGNGIKALIDKTTDIANSSRDLKKEEEDLAREKGVNPVAHAIAIDAIVPVVHPKNPVNNLTAEQLSLIYQGKITHWKEFGGPNKRILVISRDTASGTHEMWEQKILHKAKVTPMAQLQASNRTVVNAVARSKYAIGYIGIGYLKKTVKAVKVNGIEASAATALSGEYYLSRKLFMVTNGEPGGRAGDFIQFVLGGEGQELVKKEGFVPLQ